MINAELIQGKWNKMRGQIQERWGELADDDLDRFQGNVDALVGEIQQRTGESREAIEEFLERLSTQSASAATQARQYVSRAAEAAAAVPHRLARTAGDGYADTQELVRHKPVESVAVAFGTGLLMGVFIGLLIRSR